MIYRNTAAKINNNAAFKVVELNFDETSGFSAFLCDFITDIFCHSPLFTHKFTKSEVEVRVGPRIFFVRELEQEHFNTFFFWVNGNFMG